MPAPSNLIDERLVSRLAGARTITEVQNIWKENHAVLRDFTYAISLPGAPLNQPWPAKLNLEERGFLRSAFGNDFIYLVNHDVLNGRALGSTDYSIGLDNNAASYLRGVVEGTGNADDRLAFQRIFQVLSGKDFRWDLLPYMMERSDALLKGEEENMDSIRKVILAAETFAACDRGRFASSGEIVCPDLDHVRRSADAQIVRWESFLKQGMQVAMSGQYRKLYVCVLKIAAIQKQKPAGRYAGEKTAELLSWMAMALGAVITPLLWAASEYFQRGGKFPFFSKLESEGEKLVRNAQNVTWDVYHPYARQHLNGFLDKDTTFTISYFLTFDVAFAEYFDGTSQRACLFHPSYSMPRFFEKRLVQETVFERFPNNEALITTWAEVMNPTAQISRRQRPALQGRIVDELINQLEEQLLSAKNDL